MSFSSSIKAPILFTNRDERKSVTSTDTMDNTASAEPTRSRRGKGEGLSSMVIPELRKMATELGIKRTSGMRKGDLIEAIQTQLKNSGQQAQGRKLSVLRSALTKLLLW